jgi:phosphohistidine phosphatase
MHVYILRHARADFGSKVEDPPVSPEGEKQLRHVLELAQENFGFKPTLVVTSPILRARNTADIVKKKFGAGTKVVVDRCLMPEAKPGEVLDFLATLKKDENVVLVSHMPLIFELLYDLIGGRGEVELLNGSIAAVGFKGRAASGKGKLVWLVQPRG